MGEKKKKGGKVFFLQVSSRIFSNNMHDKTLVQTYGKSHQKTRSFEQMLQRAEEFITSLDEIMTTHIISKSNIIVSEYH